MARGPFLANASGRVRAAPGTATNLCVPSFSVAMTPGFRRGFLWLAGLVVLFLPVVEAPTLVSGAVVQMVLDGDATIAMWTADADRLTVIAETADSSGEPHSVEARSKRTSLRHEVRLSGLLEDRRYAFRVLNGAGGLLDEGSFRTAPGADAGATVRFGALGDSGGLPAWIWLQKSPLLTVPARMQWLPVHSGVREVAEALAARRPDFWLHTGDVIYPKGRSSHWNAGFYRPYEELLRTSPGYVVMGNHDCRDDNGRQFLENLVLPTNTVTGDERMFSFAYGPVRVVGIDLNRPEGGPLSPDHPALRYLDEVLPQVTEPWVIVYSHFPILSASRYGDQPDLIEHLVPRLRRNGVDLYLSGHDHNYQRLGEVADLPFVVTGGGGKSLYALKPHEQLKAGASVENYMLFEARDAVLRWQAWTPDGELLDEVRVDRRELRDRNRLLEQHFPRRWARIQAALQR